MAIDPKANERFKANEDERQAVNDGVFKVGAQIWVQGVQFAVVSNQGNELLLRPVSARIS